jgi:hypothetical protein
MTADIRTLWPFVFSALCLAFLFFIFTKGGGATLPLWEEGAAVESLSALGYAVAFCAFIWAGRRTRGLPRLWCWLWAFLSFVFCGEETSWLQSYLHYATPPEIAEENKQHEFNLHNLYIFQSYSMMGRSGFSLRNLLSAEILFDIGFTAYFLLLPLACLLPPLRRLAAFSGVPAPGLKFMCAAWIPIAPSVALTVITPHTGLTHDAVAEVREMFFAFTIGGFALLCARHARDSRRENRPDK